MRILIYLKIVYTIIPKLIHFSKTKIQRVTKTSKAYYRNFSHRFPIYYIFDSFSVNMFDQNYTSECHFLTGLWKVFTKLMIRHRFRWRQTAATTCSSIPLKSKCYYLLRVGAPSSILSVVSGLPMIFNNPAVLFFQPVACGGNKWESRSLLQGV